jgi:hypothetical protein
MKEPFNRREGAFNRLFNDLRDGLLALFVAQIRRLDPIARARS